jgi:hypothetical protein
MHQHSHVVQGAVVFLIFAGTVTQVALARVSSRRVVLAGLGLLLAGTVAGGVAAGAVLLGRRATANRLALPERRGQIMSAFSWRAMPA